MPRALHGLRLHDAASSGWGTVGGRADGGSNLASWQLRPKTAAGGPKAGTVDCPCRSRVQVLQGVAQNGHASAALLTLQKLTSRKHG